MVVDFDDFGANHIISDACQSHDCRDKLDQLHYANNNFKVTLFAIPAEMTYELLDWCHANSQWVELGVHGFAHSSNYECEKMTYEQFANNMDKYEEMFDDYFAKVFKAPGWQISNACYLWLNDNDWMVADQDYNTGRRPEQLPAYVNRNGTFFSSRGKADEDWTEEDAHHGHTWDCVGNGIYETYNEVESLVREAKDFKFVSEVLA